MKRGHRKALAVCLVSVAALGCSRQRADSDLLAPVNVGTGSAVIEGYVREAGDNPALAPGGLTLKRKTPFTERWWDRSLCLCEDADTKDLRELEGWELGNVNSKGQFRFVGLAAGEYLLLASFYGTEAETAQTWVEALTGCAVSVREGETCRVTLPHLVERRIPSEYMYDPDEQQEPDPENQWEMYRGR